MSKPLVSVEWVAQRLGSPGLVVLFAAMKPVGPAPATPDDGMRIPGTRTVDIDGAFSDHSTDLPHMMLKPEDFEREARALGIDRDSTVVVYDRQGIYSAPRVWWMFRAMGHERVAVLDGGLPAWAAAGLPLERPSGEPARAGDFKAMPRAGAFRGMDEVSAALRDPSRAVLDARSAGRFAGTEPEPRAGLRGGHMPGALNLPFTAVQSGGKMLPPAELRKLFEARAGKRERLVFSCGSGVTACVIALAAELAGYRELSVYDGSWAEWGAPDSGKPVAKG